MERWREGEVEGGWLIKGWDYYFLQLHNEGRIWSSLVTC